MSYQATTVIRDFANYNPAQLEQTKAALGLRMPPNALVACAAYYKKSKTKREPILTELRLLDALVTLPIQPDQIALRELFMSDSFVAATYSDMMSKRRELTPTAQAPITVREAFGLATAYLTRVGNAPKANVTVHVTSATALPNADTAVATGATHALVLGENEASIAQGDLLLLVHKAELPDWRFRTEWDHLCANVSFRALCRRIECIGESGILPLLLTIASGAFLAVDRLSAPAQQPVMECLVGEFSNCRLLIVPEQNREAVLQSLTAAELGVSVFGYATADARVGIALSPATQPVYFESAFLRSLLLRTPAIAKLPSEPKGMLDRIEHTTSASLSSAYVVKTQPAGEALHTGTCEIAAAHCQTGDGYFRSALYATLSPILSLSAAGCAYNELSLAANLSLSANSTDAEKLGEAMSTILGFYRAQTEMGSLAVRLSVEKDSNLIHPTLTVYSLAEIPALSDTFTEEGKHLYCVSVPTDSDGLPQFSTLRQMLNVIRELQARGAISARRVLCNETLLSALKKMEGAALGYTLTENAVSTGRPLSLALLFESAEELPFEKVARVEAKEVREDTDAPATEQTLPKPMHSLTYNGILEAVILYKEEDFDAIALAEILRRRSAKVSRIPMNTEPAQIARAILTAQVVFLCNATLPDHPNVQFAKKVLEESGGVMIGVGEASRLPEGNGGYRFATGIPEKDLEGLFEKDGIA